jgi:hypothetical protein
LDHPVTAPRLLGVRMLIAQTASRSISLGIYIITEGRGKSFLLCSPFGPTAVSLAGSCRRCPLRPSAAVFRGVFHERTKCRIPRLSHLGDQFIDFFRS